MASKLKRLAVVGAGPMGTDLAVRFAALGCHVVRLARPGRSRDSFEERARRAAADLGSDQADMPIELLPLLEDLPWQTLDLVIEDVREDLATKQRIFRDMVALAPPTTALTSNSSTLPLARIAAGLETSGIGEQGTTALLQTWHLGWAVDRSHRRGWVVWQTLSSENS